MKTRIFHYHAGRFLDGKPVAEQDGMVEAAVAINCKLIDFMRELVARHMGANAQDIIITSLTLIGEKEG